MEGIGLPDRFDRRQHGIEVDKQGPFGVLDLRPIRVPSVPPVAFLQRRGRHLLGADATINGLRLHHMEEYIDRREQEILLRSQQQQTSLVRVLIQWKDTQTMVVMLIVQTIQQAEDLFRILFTTLRCVKILMQAHQLLQIGD